MNERITYKDYAPEFPSKDEPSYQAITVGNCAEVMNGNPHDRLAIKVSQENRYNSGYGVGFVVFDTDNNPVIEIAFSDHRDYLSVTVLKVSNDQEITAVSDPKKGGYMNRKDLKLPKNPIAATIFVSKIAKPSET